MDKQNKAWVLLDPRVGTANQALALVEELGIEYEVKKLSYNLFAKLPNSLLKFLPIHIKSEILDSITTGPPDIIISSGRRAATLALYLKKKANNQLKIIQIMNPAVSIEQFDILILPQHDSFHIGFRNVIRTIGSVNNVQTKISKELNLGAYSVPQHYIAVIIGGSTRSYKFTGQDAIILASILSNIEINHTAHFLISFSRRTPKVVKEVMRQHFTSPHLIYDPEYDSANPYLVMLASADYIITTADSVSICSEVASVGKPLYIFCSPHLKSKKHRFFIQQLFDLEIAKNLNESTYILQHYHYHPLNEVGRVANIIKEKLFLTK